MFIYPGKPLYSPTPEGLSQALNLSFKKTPDFLYEIADFLLSEIERTKTTSKGKFLRQLLYFIKSGNWHWAPTVTHLLGEITDSEKKSVWNDLQIWKALPEWSEDSHQPQSSLKPLQPNEAKEAVIKFLKPNELRRSSQENFSEKIGDIFSLPTNEKESPRVLLAEAETGTGKTLGYVAAAYRWAEKNEGCVWISTYTKHLQRQVENELSRFYPDPVERNQKAVVLKGRENYLCLLKLQETLLPIFLHIQNNPNISYPNNIPFAFILNWAKESKDGDIKGGDLPGWFNHLYGYSHIFQLTDKEGECLHTGCLFYQRCFFESINQKSLNARLIISNHALTLIRLAQNADKEITSSMPARHFIFDESHHLQQAADNVFSIRLSSKALTEFRNRLLGSSQQTKKRKFKSLRHYLKTALIEFSQLEDALNQVEIIAKKTLPSIEFQKNFSLSKEEEKTNSFTSLTFFQNIALQLDLYSLSDSNSSFFERECDFYPATPKTETSSSLLLSEFKTLFEKIKILKGILTNLPLQAEEKDSETSKGIEIVSKRLNYYIFPALNGWISLLTPLSSPDENSKTPWIRIIRGDWDNDENPHLKWQKVRLCEHWIDPTVPLSTLLKKQALGIAYVSGTFRPYKEPEIKKSQEGNNLSWQAAKRRTGSQHLSGKILQDFQKSPFNYETQAKIYVVNDVGPSNREVAEAYTKLFLASEGGALGLFTAISRLREVYQYIFPKLSKNHIDLYAQHISSADNAQLVDTFRQNKKSCLLGTDAMRDGIDIVGSSLQLVVMDKVPWPRSDILHRERKQDVKQKESIRLEDEEAALRLRQAFGRLIRNLKDKGVFVILDRRTPSRILKALPKEIQIEKLSLSEVTEHIKAFLN
ncbi:ATP-dependent DNA helicase [Acetobacteraceae bacterium]|nr:ATP-dependent DNA helicase [Acetobacteraceae bacterium]